MYLNVKTVRAVPVGISSYTVVAFVGANASSSCFRVHATSGAFTLASFLE